MRKRIAAAALLTAALAVAASTALGATSKASANAVTASDSTYRNDSVLGGNIANDVTTAAACTSLPPECVPTRSVTGADRHNYRVDSYVTLTTPPTGRQLKLVTVVVRGTVSPFQTYAREQSTFDLSTGS